MTTEIFESFGVPVDYIILGEFALIFILFIMICISNSRVKQLTKRYESFMHGKTGADLEGIIISAFSEMDAIKKNDARRMKEFKTMRKNMRSCFRKKGLVKYDAFNQMSGTLSFSLALLNETNDGIILNCMHSREGCFTYAKEIINGESYVVLSDEEKSALQQAIASENVLEDEL